MKHRVLILSVLSLLALAGCKDITGVQTGFVADRDQCREDSQNEESVYTPSGSYGISDKEKKTALSTLFCECMRQKDWKVSGCPKPKEKEKEVAKPATPPANTTVVVVQAPPAAAEEAAPVPAKKVKPPVKKGVPGAADRLPDNREHAV